VRGEAGARGVEGATGTLLTACRHNHRSLECPARLFRSVTGVLCNVKKWDFRFSFSRRAGPRGRPAYSLTHHRPVTSSVCLGRVREPHIICRRALATAAAFFNSLFVSNNLPYIGTGVRSDVRAEGNVLMPQSLTENFYVWIFLTARRSRPVCLHLDNWRLFNRLASM